MLPCLLLLLLMGLSVCNAAGDSGKELTLSTEAEPWVAVTLEGITIPSIQLQLQEVKRSKTRRFFGLMGKQVGGIPPVQPGGRTGYQLEQTVQDLLGGRGLFTKIPTEKRHPKGVQDLQWWPDEASTAGEADQTLTSSHTQHSSQAQRMTTKVQRLLASAPAVHNCTVITSSTGVTLPSLTPTPIVSECLGGPHYLYPVPSTQ